MVIYIEIDTDKITGEWAKDPLFWAAWMLEVQAERLRRRSKAKGDLRKRPITDHEGVVVGLFRITLE